MDFNEFEGGHRMKGIRKFWIPILILMLILGLCMPVFADGTTVNRGGSGKGGGGGAGGSGTMTIKNGCSYKKTGFVYYIVDESGKIVAEPQARSTYKDITPVGTNYIDTRYGNRKSVTYSDSMQDFANWWNMPPFEEDTSGNGGRIKDWLLGGTQESGFNVLLFIQEAWDYKTAEEFVANKQYLIIEPFMWCGRYAGSIQVGDIIGTATGWAEAREGLGSSATNGYETRYSLGVLPNSMAYSIPVLNTSAPTSIYGKHSCDEIKSQGYGVIAVWAEEIISQVTPNPPVITVTNTHDYLRSNELNYIFLDIKKDSSAMRAEDTYDDADFGINAEVTSIWQKHTGSDDRNDKIKDSRWYIQESISSDIVNKLGLSNGLFYRNGAGAYFSPSNAVNLKTVSVGSGTQYAGYGYNLTRSVFGDNLVVSDFTSRGDNQAMKSYVKDVLKFTVGHDGVSSNIVMTENTEGQTSNTAKDIYTFTGKVTEYYEHNDKIHHDAEYEDEYGIDKKTGKTIVTGQKKVKDEWWEDNWNSYTEDHTAETHTHEVTHGLFKYTPYTTTTVRNTKAGNLLLATGHVGQAYSKVSFASQLSGTLSIYPEVKYEMWYTPSSETWSTPQLKSIYVMQLFL